MLSSEIRKGLDVVFNPGSVAVIGASNKFGKWGQLILSNIVAGGYKGKIFPVNPGGGTFFGLPVFKDILNIPEAIDLAFITTPANTIPEVLEACGKKGIKGVVLITSGFSETGGEGDKLERRISAICKANGIALVGPNTMGIIRPAAGLFGTGSHTRPRKGTVAFVSQSGNLGLQLIHWAEQQGIGISLFVGSGNEALITSPDYFEWLEADPQTKIIIAYLESVGDGRRFLEISRKINKKKPLIVLKGGRTEVGRAAAASHTGSMSGENEVFKAACRQAGLINISVPSDLLNLSAGFSSLPLPGGNRVGIVTLGGGWGVVTADECNEKGLQVPTIPDRIVNKIGKYLPPFWSKGNPVDLVGSNNREVPIVAVEELLKWEGIDAVICLGIVGRIEVARLSINSTKRVDPSASAEALDELATYISEYENEYVKTMVELMEQYEKPVIGVSLASTGEGTVRPIPGKRFNGIFFKTPETAVNVLASMVAYRKFLENVQP
ncbi:acetate--CoA ligase family protein [Thermodesulfobacteriota bacterium]